MAKKQKTVTDLSENKTPAYTVADSTAVVCKSCGFDNFMMTHKIRRFSKIVTGQLEDQFVPIQLMNCVNCGAVSYEILPQQLQALFLKELVEAREAREATQNSDGFPD